MSRIGLLRATRLICAPERSPFEILGLKSTATQTEIKAKYRELSKQLHPDMPDGSEEKFREVHAAFQILKSESGLNAARWAEANNSRAGGATAQRYGKAKGQPRYDGMSQEEVNRMKAEAASRDAANGWNSLTSRPLEAMCGAFVCVGAILYFISAYFKASDDYQTRRQPIALDGVIGKEFKWTKSGGKVVSVKKDEFGNTYEVEEAEEDYVSRLSDEEYEKFCQQKKIRFTGMGIYGTADPHRNKKPIQAGDFKEAIPREEKEKDEEWQKSVLEMRKNVQTRYQDFREYFFVNDSDNCLNRKVTTQRISTEMLQLDKIASKCPLVIEYQSGVVSSSFTTLAAPSRAQDTSAGADDIAGDSTADTGAGNLVTTRPQFVTPALARKAHETKVVNAIADSLGQVHFSTADKDFVALHGVVGSLRIPKFSPAQHAYTFIEYRDSESRNRTPECLVAIRNAAIVGTDANATLAPASVASQRFVISGSKDCQCELQLERDEQVARGWVRPSEFVQGGVVPVKDVSHDFESTEKRADDRRKSLFGGGEQ